MNSNLEKECVFQNSRCAKCVTEGAHPYHQFVILKFIAGMRLQGAFHVYNLIVKVNVCSIREMELVILLET